MRKSIVVAVVASFAVMLAAGPAASDHKNSPNHNYCNSPVVAAQDRYCTP